MLDSNHKRRLLILTSTYPRWANDPEPAFVHELAKRLTGYFQVAVLGPHAPGAEPEECMDGVTIFRYRYAPAMCETLVNNGGIIANLKMAPWKWLLVPGFLLAQWWAYRKLLRQWRPDVIHAHWLVPQGFVAAFGISNSKAKPLVVTSHGADLFAIRGRFFAWLRGRVIARAAAITVVSRAMQQRISQEVGNSSFAKVMPMGVDFDQRFKPDPSVARSNRQLLFVGRLVEKKGGIYLIEAMPKILSAFPDMNLTVIGFGPERDKLMQRVAALGIGDAVEFRGAVSQAELPDFYRRSTVFVAPFIEADGGDQEGLGLVVAEAIGCCCPVVVGDVPAIHDLVDRSNCSIVNSVDTVELSAAVIRVIRDVDYAQQSVKAARREIETHMSWNAVANAYASLLDSVIVDLKPCKE